MVRQAYNYYVRPYIVIKGQNLVEYAILLAIIIAIAYGIYNYTGIADSLKTIFTSAGNLLNSLWKLLPATYRYH